MLQTCLAIEKKCIDECSRLKWMMCLCFIKMASASLLEYIFILQCHIPCNEHLYLYTLQNEENFFACKYWFQRSSFIFLNFRNPNTLLFSFLFWLPDFFPLQLHNTFFASLYFYVMQEENRRITTSAVATAAELLQYARTRTESDVIWTSFFGRHTSESGVWCASFSFMILLDCYWIFDTFQMCVCSSLAMLAYA